MLTRRQCLQIAAASGLSACGMRPLTGEEARLPADGIALDSSTAPLVKLLEDTPREKLQRMLVDQLELGVPYRKLLEAVFLYPVLWQGHHSAYIVHAAHQLSLDVSAEDRILPLFWAVDVMKEHLTRFKNTKVRPLPGKLPSPEKAQKEFTAAMESQNREQAQRAVIALSRVIGPKPTFRKLLHYASRDQSFIGHIPIAMVNAYRVLPVIGWRHAECVLRWVADQMFGRHLYPLEKQSYPHNVERVKESLAGLPIDWAKRASDDKAALELYELMLSGTWWKANEWIVNQLKSGRIQAGTVWDAIHLACADLMICHRKGGDRLGNRALHSNTCVNALHYVFRELNDPAARLLTLFQAVTVAVSFRGNERKLDLLRERRIVDIQPEEIGSPEETVTAIFDALPPRIFLEEQEDRSGQDNAAKLAYSFATAYSDDSSLLSTARRIMCRKLTLDAHEMKFPIAMFEDTENVSPTWRPHMTAATIVYMQGTNSVDNPAVARGIAECGRG